MKKFKKVVPALCALLVSAVMLGSSTYAWFSMNTRVTAQGMQVTAQSNSTYLVVSANDTLATETNVNVTKKTGGIGGNTTNVYPCAKATDKIGKIVNAGEWYYASSKKQDDAGSMGTGGALGENTMNVTKIGPTLTQDYKVTYTFYIGVSKESAAKTAKIKIDAADETLGSSKASLDKGLCAIVTIDGKDPVTIKQGTDTMSGIVSDVALTTAATSVTVEIYIDGNNTNVTSANAASLAGLQLNLALSIVE